MLVKAHRNRVKTAAFAILLVAVVIVALISQFVAPNSAAAVPQSAADTLPRPQLQPVRQLVAPPGPGVTQYTPVPVVTPTNTPLPIQAMPSFQPPPPARPATCGLLTDFEQFGRWRRGDEPYGTFEQSSEQIHSGNFSGKLTYTFPTAGNDYVVFQRNIAMGGQGTALSAWVYGDGSGHYLNAWVKDAQGEAWSFTFGPVRHVGWQQMVAPFNTVGAWPNGHVSGPANGALDYPIDFQGFVLDDNPDTFVGSGAIYIDDLSCLEGVPQVVVPVPNTAPVVSPGINPGLSGANPVPGAITVFFTLDATGRPSGFVVDKLGNYYYPEGGFLALLGPMAAAGDRIVLQTNSPRFALLWDCGLQPNSFSPCDFVADSLISLPPQIMANGGGSPVINISGPDNWGQPRPRFEATQRYPAEPVLRILLNGLGIPRSPSLPTLPIQPPVGVGTGCVLNLIGPANGSAFGAGNETVNLQWQLNRPLGPNEYFFVNVPFPHGGTTWYDGTWRDPSQQLPSGTRDQQWTLRNYLCTTNASDTGQYSWYVELRQQLGPEPSQSDLLLCRSAAYVFSWTGCAAPPEESGDGGGGGSGDYDLYVRRMDYSPGSPSAGTDIAMHIMIASDVHPDDGPYFPASHYKWRSRSGASWHEESCSENTHYATCERTIHLSYDHSGDYDFEVRADSQNEVDETNEGNNSRIVTIHVN